MIDLQQAELIAKILTASYIDKDGRVMFSEFEHFIKAKDDAIEMFPELVKELKMWRESGRE